MFQKSHILQEIKLKKFCGEERVSINYETVSKNSKAVNIDDIIVIRGFGKYRVKEVSRTTKSGKLVITLLH